MGTNTEVAPDTSTIAAAIVTESILIAFLVANAFFYHLILLAILVLIRSTVGIPELAWQISLIAIFLAHVYMIVELSLRSDTHTRQADGISVLSTIAVVLSVVGVTLRQ
jgi:hypothetical protein